MSNASVWRTKTNEVLQKNEVASGQNQQLQQLSF